MANAFTGSADQLHKGSFRADDLKLTMAGINGDGALVQQANFTITRQINMMYEIGSTNVYYVGGRRQGQVQMQRIVGGSANFKQLVTKYGDMCKPDKISLEAQGGCGGASGKVTYDLLGATITQIGASVTAQEVVITESLGFIFSDLQIN